MADASSRQARTATRTKVRAKVAREERLKAQVEGWVGAPLRASIRANETAVGDLNRQLQVMETDLMAENRKVRDRVHALDNSLSQIVKDEISAAMTLFKSTSEQGRVHLETQVGETSAELRRLKETVSQENEKFKAAFTAMEVSMARRLEDLEHFTRDYKESRDSLHKLAADFRTYVEDQSQRDVYAKRLEFLVKDMEKRVWPWRPNMDRSQSPPPRQDFYDSTTQCLQDGNIEWLPWPSNGPVKTEKCSGSTSQVSPHHSPPASARPTPPSSRPNSARFRGRDASAAGSAVAAVRGGVNPPAGASSRSARPQSARSAR